MIDQVALLPAYCAAGTALLAFVVDLIVPGRRLPVLGVVMLGAVATAVASGYVYRGGMRQTFCAGAQACSYQWDGTAALVGVLFAVATLVVAALSVPTLREVPAGEYCFLLGCSL